MEVEAARIKLRKSDISASSSFSAVMRHEGAAGLWRGNGLAVMRAMMQNGCVFGTQDHLRIALGSDMFAGAIAGLTAGAFTYPLDLLRTRHAGQVGSGSLVEVARATRRFHSFYRSARSCEPVFSLFLKIFSYSLLNFQRKTI